MRRSENERDSYRPHRSGRDWRMSGDRSFEGDSYSSDRGFDRDYDHSETQHFDRGYPSEHDREISRNYSDADNGRISSGRMMDTNRRNGFDDSYMDRDTTRDSWRSNNNRPYDFNRSNRGWNDTYGNSSRNSALNDQGLSGQSWGGSERADRMRFDSDRSGRDIYRSSSMNSTNTNSNSDYRYGRDYYDTSYGTGYGSSYGSTGYSSDYAAHGNDRMERGGHFGRGPKGWKRSDERIREEVCEALYRAHDVDASDIDVVVKDGTVTLSGTVESREAKRSAESCVERLSGVDDVTNELKAKKNEGLIGKGQTYVQGQNSSSSTSSTGKIAKLS